MTFAVGWLKTFGPFALQCHARYHLEVLNPSMFSYRRVIIRT